MRSGWGRRRCGGGEVGLDFLEYRSSEATLYFYFSFLFKYCFRVNLYSFFKTGLAFLGFYFLG